MSTTNITIGVNKSLKKQTLSEQRIPFSITPNTPNIETLKAIRK